MHAKVTTVTVFLFLHTKSYSISHEVHLVVTYPTICIDLKLFPLGTLPNLMFFTSFLLSLLFFTPEPVYSGVDVCLPYRIGNEP